QLMPTGAVDEQNPRIFLLTGKPGSGKTTLAEHVYRQLKERGFKIGGILTREVRLNGQRIGFKIENLQTGDTGWLAKAQEGSGPVYGRYCVNVEDLDRVGVKALEGALHDEAIDLVIVDEVGPMEMSSQRFAKTIEKLLGAISKPVLVTFKEGTSYRALEKTVKSPYSVKFELTSMNRYDLLARIVQMIENQLRLQGS
ncbi:MAG TPA: NTPase, partial [Candidatus Binatus sp.]|nr:NTPase [Candidatus Binatus sp.]